MIFFVAILIFLFAIVSVFITLAALISALPLLLPVALVALLYSFVSACMKDRSVV